MTKISRQEVESELIIITRQLLQESGESHHREVKTDASLERHLGIDSLARAELFRRIEKKFDITLTDRTLAEAETLNDIATALLLAEPRKFSILTTKIASHGARPDLDPSNAKSLIDILFLYGEKSPDDVHIYFQKENGEEEIVTYGKLLQSSLRVAKGLKNLGLKHGETVAIMQPTHPNFFYTFLGILLAGGIPVPIYPPFRMHLLEAYAQTEARILRNAEVRMLVTFDQAEKLSLLLKSFIPSLKHVMTVDEIMQDEVIDKPFKAESSHPALIQYTSGSTADPKGVLLTHYNLLSNIRAYGKAVEINKDDVVVSWLPLYHDMGLIGTWLGSLYFGLPLILMTPFSFLNHPEKWLWAIHYHRGTLSAAPNFAYELCIRKIDASLIEGLDLSSWRVAANGAEKIYPRTLIEFTKKFEPYGFKKEALLPVYGLAESTVGLAVSSINHGFSIDYIDRKLFEEKNIAKISSEKDALAFVACGKTIEGHEIRIVDDEDNPLPDRIVGNLQCRGPSLMQGYYNSPDATQAAFHQGWFNTGDLAYKADEEIYITGRKKDLIIKSGRNIYPAEIEELTETINGIRKGCVAAFEVTNQEYGTGQLVIVAETKVKDKTERQHIIDEIQNSIASSLDIVPDQVVLVDPHAVPKTSSGKLQRALCKKWYEEGRLGKKQIPAFLQMAKLFGAAMLQKCIKASALLFRFIYSVYAFLITVITFIPVFFIIQFTSRDTGAKAIKHWAVWVLRLVFCPVTVTGKEKLSTPTPVIFAPNHTSYIDSLLMLSILPYSTRFVAKQELYSLPILRGLLKKLDYLGINRLDFSKGLQDTQKIQHALQSGYPIMIFPEGTFGYASGLRPFKLGAFKIAAETGVPVCPIGIKGMRVVLRADEILLRPNHVMVNVSDPISPTGTEWHDVTNLRNGVRAEILKYCGEPSLDFIAAHTVAPHRDEL